MFVYEQKVPIELEIDEYEKDALHFIGYVDQLPVVASRLRFVNGDGKLERICVLKEHRNSAYGKQIIQLMENHIRQRELKTAILNAQVHAIGFYEKLGYIEVSEPFQDAGIPHVTMSKRL